MFVINLHIIAHGFFSLLILVHTLKSNVSFNISKLDKEIIFILILSEASPTQKQGVYLFEKKMCYAFDFFQNWLASPVKNVMMDIFS